MAKLDEVKERLSELKFWRGIMVGLIIALSGWIFTSLYTGLYAQIDKVFLVVVFVGIIILCIILAFVTKLIFNKIKEIKNL